MSSPARLLGVLTVVATAAVVLTGCQRFTPQPGAIEVVGAERQYADVAAAIGGRYVQVTAVLASPYVDPHSFEAGTRVAAAIADARLIVQNGMGYDDFMASLESATTGTDRQVLVAQDLVGAPANGFNPHLWYRPSTMPVVAAAIEHSLARIDPAHASYYAANLTREDAQLAAWDAEVARFRASRTGASAAVTEPVANYLFSALGIRVATPIQFQRDVMNGIDPAPQDIAVAQQLFDTHAVNLFGYNRQVTDAVTSGLIDRARANEIPIVALYETMPAGYHFASWMMAETRAIERAVTSGTSTESL